MDIRSSLMKVLAFLLVPCTGVAQEVHRDPVGDAGSAAGYADWPDPALRLPVGYRSPDIVSVESRLEGDYLTVTVRFAPGTYDRDRTKVTVGVDADRDTSTGSKLAGWTHGIDYEAELWATRPSTVRPYTRRVRRLEASPVSDGITARIHLDEFPPEDGGVEVTVFAAALMRDYGGGRYSTTGHFDAAPGGTMDPGRIVVRGSMPDWVGTWSLDDAATGGGPPEVLRFGAGGTGTYETRYWRGAAPFTYAAAGADKVVIRGLPNGWTATAQRFTTGRIQLHVDRGGGSVGLMPFNRVGAPAAPSSAAVPAQASPSDPFVGHWTDAIAGTPLEVFADGRVVMTLSGSGRDTHTLRYTRSGSTATLAGYPGGTATMRIGETGTLFVNYTAGGSRGMRMYRRTSP